MIPSLTFLGGAGTVTGSRFLVETDWARVLVDCGLFQGIKALRLRNWEPFPVDPASIDAVVITHAHIDHIGALPILVRDGYAGPVYVTPSTAELAAIVLPDSGRLHEEDAEYANRKGFSKHRPALPLYTEADAERAVRSLRPVTFGRRIEVAKGVTMQFDPAGHILGSAVVSLNVSSPSREPIDLAFSGDLGRPDHPLIVAPQPPHHSEVVVMESTYGNRDHADEGALAEFAAAIADTAERGGMILIPAFAVDRTEVILYHLHQLREAGEIPPLTTYVDSPMALRALEVYRAAIERGDPDIRPEASALVDALGGSHVVEAHTVDESKALAGLTMPSIIVSASGMATGGRVLHHLRRLLPDRRNTVILVGFQAPGTRGRSLADGADEVKMFGQWVPVRAEVVTIPAFSVHADRDELEAWVAGAQPLPHSVHLVHGEPTAAEALKERLAERGFATRVADDGDQVLLDRRPWPEP